MTSALPRRAADGETAHLHAAGQRLEACWWSPRPDDAHAAAGSVPPIVLLHEGLGSVALWRGFPQALADATSRRVFAYSRLGHGRSEALAGRRPLDHMEREARDVLPLVLQAAGIGAGALLVGHSDGASIALVHAGMFAPGTAGAAAGVVAIAPHLFVEPVALEAILHTRAQWESTDLRARLARYHDDAEGAFRGWVQTWLDPRFEAWNVEAYVARIGCPVLAIQGRDDQYGSLRQIDRIAELVPGTRRLVIDACRHSPHLEHPDVVLEAVAAFAREV